MEEKGKKREGERETRGMARCHVREGEREGGRERKREGEGEREGGRERKREGEKEQAREPALERERGRGGREGGKTTGEGKRGDKRQLCSPIVHVSLSNLNCIQWFHGIGEERRPVFLVGQVKRHSPWITVLLYVSPYLEGELLIHLLHLRIKYIYTCM